MEKKDRRARCSLRWTLRAGLGHGTRGVCSRAQAIFNKNNVKKEFNFFKKIKLSIDSCKKFFLPKYLYIPWTGPMNTKSDFRDITAKVFKSGATLSPVTLKDNTILESSLRPQMPVPKLRLWNPNRRHLQQIRLCISLRICDFASLKAMRRRNQAEEKQNMENRHPACKSPIVFSSTVDTSIRPLMTNKQLMASPCCHLIERVDLTPISHQKTEPS